jgi:group I intron endonuclease
MSKYGIVYCAVNINNGKRYIGKTASTIKRRKYQHEILAFYKKKNGYKSNTYFHRALRKYGKENFRWEVLGYFDESMLSQMETHFIKLLESFSHLGSGYNKTYGGEGTVGIVRDDTCRKNMSIARLGKPTTGMLNKHHTVESKKKMRDKKIGKFATKETRKKMRDSHMGEKNIFFGRRHSIESRIKIREGRSSVRLTKEDVRNIKYSLSNGSTCSDISRLYKISKTQAKRIRNGKWESLY